MTTVLLICVINVYERSISDGKISEIYMFSKSTTTLQKTRLCVLATCFNRKESTLSCLRRLERNMHDVSDLTVDVILLDDGSTDGTAAAVLTEFPFVRVVRGDGDLYWCRSMSQIFQMAIQEDYDFYLWLNDDTLLVDDALRRLLACEEQMTQRLNKPVLIVGSTKDARTGLLTYGGELRVPGIRRMRFRRVQPNTTPQQCDSMNGNIVLLSRQAVGVVGNLDPVFEHAMGDTDYALRANGLNVGVWVAPGFYGTCSDNSRQGTFHDSSLSIKKRWRLIMLKKGLPWRSWLVLTRRHAGVLWPLHFLWPYFSLLAGFYNSRKRA